MRLEGWTQGRSFPRCSAPELSEKILPPSKGRGECRVPNAPAASRANEKSTRVSPPRARQSSPAFPHANGFNDLWRALPGESGFLATVPSAMRKHFRRVDASVEASGPHAFAVREPVVVSRRAYVHRIPAQRFVTTAKRPLLRAGTREFVEMICPTAKGKYFWKKGWTGRGQRAGARR